MVNGRILLAVEEAIDCVVDGGVESQFPALLLDVSNELFIDSEPELFNEEFAALLNSNDELVDEFRLAWCGAMIPAGGIGMEGGGGLGRW